MPSWWSDAASASPPPGGWSGQPCSSLSWLVPNTSCEWQSHLSSVSYWSTVHRPPIGLHPTSVQSVLNSLDPYSSIARSRDRTIPHGSWDLPGPVGSLPYWGPPDEHFWLAPWSPRMPTLCSSVEPIGWCSGSWTALTLQAPSCSSTPQRSELPGLSWEEIHTWEQSDKRGWHVPAWSAPSTASDHPADPGPSRPPAGDSGWASDRTHPAGNHSRSLLRSPVPLLWQQGHRTCPSGWWNGLCHPDGPEPGVHRCYFAGLVLSSRFSSVSGIWLKAAPRHKPISLSSL